MSKIALEQIRGDRFAKQLIIFTICGIAVLFSVTVCTLVLTGRNIPDALDRLVTFIIGNITGMLTKTGVEKWLDNEPVAVKNAPGDTLDVQASDKDKPNASEAN